MIVLMFYSSELFFSHIHSRNIAIGLICFILFLLFNILNCVEMKRIIGYVIRLGFTNGYLKNSILHTSVLFPVIIFKDVEVNFYLTAVSTIS